MSEAKSKTDGSKATDPQQMVAAGDDKDADAKSHAIAAPGSERPRVRLDTSRMKSSYCNVCNATSTREEVVLNFGLNQNWEHQEDVLDILIEHRIILTPPAAQRLRDVLNQLLEAHESKYGGKSAG